MHSISSSTMMSPKVRTTAAPTFSITDPDFANVELLLTMEGVDGETTFTDLSSNAYTMTPSGVTTSNTYSKFGSTSADIAGAIDNQITTPSGVLDDTMSWTIECWVRITAPAYGGSSRTDPFYCIAYEYKGGGNSDQVIYITSGGVLAFFRGVGHTDATSSTSCSSGSNTVAFDEWQHVAICFDQADQEMYMFIQGNKVADARPIADGGWFASTNVFNIGNWSHPSYSVWRSTMNGYMEQFRVTSVCRYKNSFHVPIYPFSRQDQFFSSVKLLLPLDGTDAATTTTDESNEAHVITFNANAQIDTAQSKFGGASALFDGTGDYLSIPDALSLSPETDSLTVECHVRFNGDPTTDQHTFVSKWNNGGLTIDKEWWVGYRNNTLNAFLSTSGSNGLTMLAVTWDPAGDTWYHIAFVYDRSLGTDETRVYVDGTKVGTSNTALNGNAFFQSASDVWVGGYDDDANDWMDGWIDNVRITKGAPRYTANFTAPTVPFPTL